MIYLKTSVGVELRGEDMLFSALQSNFSGGVFTHFKRIRLFRLSSKEDLQREINHFFKSNRLSKDNIVLGIPRRDIVLRYLDLPSEVADNLKQVIQYQVQSFEPTEEDRYYYDYALLNSNGARKRLSVLLVMVRKAVLDYHLGLLFGLGIRPTTIIGSSMGLANIFLHGRKEMQDKTFMLADLSSSGLELLALRHGAFVYSREAAKENNQSWKDLILNEIDEAASKMRLGSNDTVEKIILAGESSESAHGEIKASIPDCQLMKNSIQFDVPGENKPYLQEASSTLGLAFTGAVRRPAIKINLLPAELRVHRTRWVYVPTAIFGLAIIALLLAFGFRQTFQNRILVRELDREIQKLDAPIKGVQSIQAQAEALEKKVQSIEGILQKRDMNLEILQELTAILPPDTYLISYNYKDGTIQLAGLSGSSSDLIPKLERSTLLKDVIQKGPIFKDPQTGKDRFSYEAKLEK